MTAGNEVTTEPDPLLPGLHVRRVRGGRLAVIRAVLRGRPVIYGDITFRYGETEVRDGPLLLAGQAAILQGRAFVWLRSREPLAFRVGRDARLDGNLVNVDAARRT